MSKRLHYNRVGHLERLELRTLLAGIVDVDLDAASGDLFARGDDENNSIEIRLAKQFGPNAYRIIPDGTTAINDLPAGSPLLVRGVTGAMRVELLGGDDQLRIVAGDRVSVTGLSVQSGTGNDDVRVSQLNVNGTVSIESSSGASQTTLSHLSISDPADNIALSVRGSDVNANDVRVEGSAEFHVGGGGGAGKAVFQDLSVTKYIDKASPILLVDAPGPGSEVSVRGAYIEGSAEFHVGGGGGAGKAVFQDLSVTKYIDKATPKLLVDAPGPGSEVSVRGAYIEGSAEFHVGGGGGAGKAVFQDLSVTKYIDKATPKLLVDAPGPGSEVSVRGAYIEGSAEFHVGGGGGAGKAVFQDLSVTKYIDKATPKLLVDAPGPGSEVSVRGAYIEGSAEFHIGGGGGAGKAVFQDLSVTKYIDKATPKLLVDAPGPGSEVSVRGAYIEGSAEFHVGGGGGAGKAVFQDLSVTKYIDKATPKLLVDAPGPGSEVSVRGAYIEGSAEFHVGGGGGAGKAVFQDLSVTKYIDKASPILLVDAPGPGSEVSVRGANSRAARNSTSVAAVGRARPFSRT